MQKHSLTFCHRLHATCWAAKMWRWLTVLTTMLAIGLCGASPLGAESGCTAPLITEVQTGAAAAGSTSTNFRYEFVELYNCSPQPIALDGYRLELKNAAGQLTVTVPLAGELPAHGFMWVAHNSYKTHLGGQAPSPAIVFGVGAGNLNALAADGGSVVVLNATGQATGVVEYGPQPLQAPVPPSNQSIKRCTAGGVFRESTSSAQDFLVTALPTLSAVFSLGPACPASEPPAEDPPLEEPPAEPTPACEGLLLTEILPNPAGSDSGREFIEVHNPTTMPVDLLGCSLRLNDGAPFALPSEQLAPGAYWAFYDSQTGITLPNSAGGVVWLLSTASEQSVIYDEDLSDDQAWAYSAGVWQTTYRPTPAEPNQLVATPGQGSGEPQALAVCAEGQERNPATNRCRAIVVAASAQPCKPGQERNPETNRCRNIAVATAEVASCNAGQERNPETNRCRTIATEATTAPCTEGQERNPETGRCRKILVADLPKTVEDVAAPQAVDPKWWLAGTAAVGLVGYGVYEWRRDIAKGLGKLSSKLKGGKG